MKPTHIIDPMLVEDIDVSDWAQEYAADLARSYAAYLDKVVLGSMTPFERFIVKTFPYWASRRLVDYAVGSDKDGNLVIFKNGKLLHEINPHIPLPKP